MIYKITNLKTGKTQNFEYPRGKMECRAWLKNSASRRSETKIFKDIAIYGVNNFLIETEIEFLERKEKDKSSKRKRK